MDHLCPDLAVCSGKFQGTPGSFAGAHTTRNAGKPLGESCVAQKLAMHPLVLQAVRARLQPWCKRFVLGTCSAIDVGPPPNAETPPAPPQVLHRDESMWPASDFYFPPECRPEFCVSVMWAVSDFAPANGATRLIPGSHRWDRSGMESYDEDDAIAQDAPQQQEHHQKEPQLLEDLCVSATMSKGSVLLWSGATIHGQGGHTPWTPKDVSATTTRRGLIFIYNLGWLRPEHNLHWALPPNIIRDMPEPLRELMGVVGTNSVDDEWYTEPVYAQPLLGMAPPSKDKVDDKCGKDTGLVAETYVKAAD